MNVVLDSVDDELTNAPVLVWVDGGEVDLFTLRTKGTSVVVWSTRYLEMASAVRSLLVSDYLSRQLKRDLARQAALRVVAEGALRAEKYDLAVRSFCAAYADAGIFLPTDSLQDLEVAEISETYVIGWFFGLCHEFGHHCDAWQPSGILSDDAIAFGLEQGIKMLPGIDQLPQRPEEIIALARSDVKHPLQPAHVREEIVADLFGTTVILNATSTILERAGKASPDPLRMIHELKLALFSVSFLERCKGLVELFPVATQDARLAHYLLHPATMFVRQRLIDDLLIKFYLRDLHLNSSSPSYQRLRSEFDKIDESHGTAVGDLDSGLADAMRFLFWSSTPTTGLVEQLAESSTGSDGALLRVEVSTFYQHAVQHQGRSPNLDAVLRVLSDEQSNNVS